VLCAFLLLAASPIALALPRVATLDAGHAQIVMALGGEASLVLVPADPLLVGQAARAERYQRRPSAEGLLAARPELLIGANPARDREWLEQADRLGIDSVMIERTLPATERIRRIAERLGRPRRGIELIARIESRYAQAAVIAADHGPVRVLHVSSSGADGAATVTGAGRATSADGLIRRVGGINVGPRPDSSAIRH